MDYRGATYHSLATGVIEQLHLGRFYPYSTRGGDCDDIGAPYPGATGVVSGWVNIFISGQA